MTTACESFFTLPELIALVTPHLSRQDIIHLIRTNRRLHDICTPLLWHSVHLLEEDSFDNTNTAQARLLASPEGLRAFYNNINNIRAVYWKADFSWSYLHAVLAYLNTSSSRSSGGQDSLEDMEQDIISTYALTHSGSGGMETPDPLAVILLPPLRRLTSYKAFTGIDSYGSTNDDLPSEYRHGPHQHQTFWLLRLNSSTLVHLDLWTLDLNSSAVVRDLCRTISELQHLRTLRLNGLAPNEIPFRALKVIFFSCPSSLEELYIRPIVGDREETLRLDPLEGGWDYGQGPVVLRKEPLHWLKTLEIPSSYTGYQAPLLCSILEHCPALELFQVPSLRSLMATEKVAETIGKYCPHITSLVMPRPFWDNKGVTIMATMEAIPSQQLTSFELFAYLDYFPDRLVAAWTRHSETLQTIKLTSCRTLASAALRTALVNCRSLEVLELTEFYSSKCCLTLEDAVMDKWACTRIRTLNIPVKLTTNGKSPLYLTNPSKGRWKKEDHAHWNMLGRFYAQIGSLTQLRVLDLRSAASIHAPSEVDPDHMREIAFEETCLPGMLILEDLTKERLGYLSKLAGLTQLQELRGSIVWEFMPEDGRMSEREVDWLVDHLPVLSVAHFLPKGYEYPEEGAEEDEVPEVLQVLQSRRPGLVMAPPPYDNSYI
ncbi:hypothetical protein BG015_000714 [Linnemannia schmuckeri]|uniref:F-box domain-containing protein n=1 Tax=Linnemannia schmuckeri TaxID=64567 RepID=A0A9P5RU62_9FUNG|nr:hypothetical protein BG015_000714 [Linnemannia schmuckeri]